MSKAIQSRPRYAKVLPWVAAAFGFLIVALLLAGALLKYEIVPTLRQKFGSDVQMQSLSLTGKLHPVLTASGVVLTLKNHPGIPPLIRIEHLTLSAPIRNLLRLHISSVHLQGVQIRVPPRQAPAPGAARLKPEGKIHFPLVIDEVTLDDTLLETLPSDSRHSPHDFKIRQVVFRHFSFDRPASFQATLTSPKPIGDIESAGQFGPWHSDQPGDTPLSGNFQYSHADFSTIRGLSGTMSSHGAYGGTIEHIDVEGDTSMPDFALAIAGNPMPLTTHYNAVVDGATGNTYLQSVHARLGSSPIDVQGEIAHAPGKGAHILLNATSKDARLQDFLRLAIKGPPPLAGTISLSAKIDLPPSEQTGSEEKKKAPPGASPALDHSRIDTMKIAGQFGIDNARFTNPGTEHRLDALSRAGQGQPKDSDIQETLFNLRGRFDVNQAVARLSQIDFRVPGAEVQLRGSYGLESENIDFHGHLLLDATLADTTTGIKSLLLRVVDPFFKRRGGGSSIPFRITGTRRDPRYGLDRGAQ